MVLICMQTSAAPARSAIHLIRCCMQYSIRDNQNRAVRKTRLLNKKKADERYGYKKEAIQLTTMKVCGSLASSAFALSTYPERT